MTSSSVEKLQERLLTDFSTFLRVLWKHLGLPDPKFPEDHPRQWIGRSAVNAVAYDLFPPPSPLRRLYESESVLRFIDDILERGTLHRYADPLGALNLASMGHGDELQ